jgi:methyl-accepting chemotaxis protein
VPKKKPDPRETPSPLDTPLGRIELLLEDMRSQNRATVEAMLAAQRETNERIGELDSRLSGRIDSLALAVRGNSKDIRKNSEDIRKNSEDIRKNSEDIQRVEQKLDRKADAESVRDLAARVARLEQARPR